MLARGIDHFRVGVVQCRASQAGQPFDVALARGVPDIDAFAALDDGRSGLAKCRQIGIGLDQRFDVALLQIGQ